MSNPFTTPIADALRAAAFDCDGTDEPEADRA